MILTINHETVYRYDTAAAHSTQYLRLTPRDGDGQHVLEWKLELPVPAFACTDSFGNVLHVLTLDMPHDCIRIRATGIVETEAGERMCFDGDARPYLRSTALTTMSPAMETFAESFREASMSLAAVERLAHAIHGCMAFDTATTHAATTAAEAFGVASGVCQDYTHIFIACCRHLGVPARYVSGYVHSSGHRLEDHQASHAWAEAWSGDRWWSFDVLNRCRAGATHLKLAVGMDYMDACPVRGVRRGGGTEHLSAAVRVMQGQPGQSPEALQQALEQQQQQQ
ncbi:MAG: protein containing transglutaminase-like domain [Moraxellaceae bacterium]|jgi:transglutaminase-like putative cysteine protease|nr:protein containing transglutaminase-like domain [Moraxellaceae bacterium]MDF3029955.1 protein containing transglutaminase-like domain [Moraxellaceae bacterium]